MGLVCGRVVLVGVLAVATAASACTEILGNDFEIVPGASNSVAGATSGSGASGPGGAGGGGGTVLPPAFECAWKPGTVREALSLEGDDNPEWTGEMHAALANAEMRVAIERAGVELGQLDVHTLWGTGPRMASFPGGRPQDARSLSNDEVALLYIEDNLDGTRVSYLSIPNSSTTGEFEDPVWLTHSIFVLSDTDAAIAPLGPGGTFDDIAVAMSFQRSGDERLGALAYYIDQVTDEPFDFDSEVAGADDFALQGYVRKSDGNNVVFLGDVLAGAEVTQVFETPDISAVTELEPVATISDILLGLEPRSDGRILAVYARPLDNGTLEAHVGAVDEAALTTHTPDDLALAGDLGSLNDYPRGGQPRLTDDSFSLVGNIVGQTELSILVVHSAGTVRINQSIPWPEPDLFPATSVFITAAHAIVNPNLFDQSGGDIMVAWVLGVDGSHHRLYYGELSCAVPTP
jgi:hypothetical protein